MEADVETSSSASKRPRPEEEEEAASNVEVGSAISSATKRLRSDADEGEKANEDEAAVRAKAPRSTVGKVSAWEEEVGITEFLGKCEPWVGIVKHRFTDFQVHEIALDGQVVRLTDITTVPTEDGGSGAETKDEKTTDNQATTSGASDAAGAEDEAARLRKAEEEAAAAESRRIAEAEAEQKAKEEAEQAEAKARADLNQLLGEEEATRVFEWIEQIKAEQGERKQQLLASGGTEAAQDSDSQRGGRGRRGGRVGRGGRGGRGGGRGDGIVEYKELKLAPSDDKARRTEVHKAFRQHFEGFLDTKTEADSVVVMVVGRSDQRNRSSSSRGGGRSDTNKQQQQKWPSCWGDYLRFVLYKENKDTTAAVTLLAKFTNKRANRFTYAGTKDKRGVTTQHMTIYRMRAEQLRGLNPKLFGMQVGNYSYVDKPLRLGDLWGNRFTVILREVKASEEQINKSLAELNRTGFINYYGLQRFGTSSVGTHRIGILLMQGKWKEANALILEPRPFEDAECTKARKYWVETGDIGGTLKKLPRQLHVERLLLQGYQKMGHSQHLVAFQSLPRNLRMLYPHSFQSYVWNLMASERVRRYGADKPVVGDLVLLSKEQDAPEPMDEEGEAEEDEQMEQEENASAEDDHKFNVKVLTEEDLPNYTIDDVVLPLPGYKIKYPEHEVGAAYARVLSEHGLSHESFHHKVRDFRLPGSYRHLLARPVDLTWEIIYFEDLFEDLLLTDRQELDGTKQETKDDKEEGLHEATRPRRRRFRGVKVAFSLRSSSYATMLLRELMKQESSIDVQKLLFRNAQQERQAEQPPQPPQPQQEEDAIPLPPTEQAS